MASIFMNRGPLRALAACLATTGLLLAISGQLVAATRQVITAIDAEGKMTPELAERLCTSPEEDDKIWVLGKPSSVIWLNHYLHMPETFSGSSKSEWQTKCLQEYEEPLTDLAEVLATDMEDVCSQKKVAMIADWHRKYIIAKLSKKWSKMSDKEAPGALKIFFMHYGLELSSICKSGLIENLELAVGQTNIDYNAVLDTSFARMIDNMQVYMNSVKNMKDWDDFILLWDMLDDKNRFKGKALAGEKIDEKTGERVGLLVKLKAAHRVRDLQTKCRYELRPVYAPVTLPLMHLIELGYYKKDKLVGESDLLRTWYAVTQLCEAVLPIRAFEDQSLNDMEAIIITKEEAEQLDYPEDQAPANRVSSVKIKPATMDRDLQLVQPNQIEAFVLVKSQVKARRRFYRRLVNNFVTNLKGKAKNYIKSIFVSKKSRSKDGKVEFVKEKAKPAIDASLVETTEYLNEFDENTKLESMASKKRSIWHYIVPAYMIAASITSLTLMILGFLGIIHLPFLMG